MTSKPTADSPHAKPRAASTPTSSQTPTRNPTGSQATSSAKVADVKASPVLVIYRAEGGFAGVRDTLTVYADGRTELDLRPGSTVGGQATKAQLTDLTRLINSKEFASAKTEYGHKQGLDRTTFAIVIGDKTITLAGPTTSPNTVPKPVAQAQVILDTLMTELRSR